MLIQNVKLHVTKVCETEIARNGIQVTHYICSWFSIVQLRINVCFNSIQGLSRIQTPVTNIFAPTEQL